MDKSTPDPRPHTGRPDAAPAPQSEQDAPPGFLGATFASLAYRNFVYLWLGQVTHAGALWIDMVARPLLVLAVTDSAVHLGLVMSARTVPAIALGLFAGVLADNFNRRMMLLATKVIVFGFGTLFALLLFFGLLELWHIYLFTFLRGATQAFDQPARRALVPSAVPRHLVTNAMALSSGTVQIMRIAGAGGRRGDNRRRRDRGGLPRDSGAVRRGRLRHLDAPHPRPPEAGVPGGRRHRGGPGPGAQVRLERQGGPRDAHHLGRVLHLRDGVHAGVRAPVREEGPGDRGLRVRLDDGGHRGGRGRGCLHAGGPQSQDESAGR